MKKPKFHRMADYDPALLPNAHLAELDRGCRTPEQWVARTGHSVGYPAWGLLYYAALCRLDPDGDNAIVETGTNLGCSAIVLGQALRDSRGAGAVHTIEIDAAKAAGAVENLRRAGLGDLVHVHVGDSLELLPSILDRCPTLTIAFLDGNHACEHVLREFDLILPRLRDDALVLMDNTYALTDEHLGEDPRVHGALRRILDRHGGNLVNFPNCSWHTPGLAIWQRCPLPAPAASARIPQVAARRP